MYKTQKAKEEKVQFARADPYLSPPFLHHFLLLSLSLSLSIDLFLLSQEEQRQRAKRNREELRVMMEEHEEVHSGIRWRRVCAIFEDHPLWKAVNPEERKDVFEDVTFALAKKERVRIDGGRGGKYASASRKGLLDTHTHAHTYRNKSGSRERETAPTWPRS